MRSLSSRNPVEGFFFFFCVLEDGTGGLMGAFSAVSLTYPDIR